MAAKARSFMKAFIAVVREACGVLSRERRTAMAVA
eukprot:COSAG02_NODE_61234_length_269_cov_0.611765_1_plen_34_part_01